MKPITIPKKSYFRQGYKLLFDSEIQLDKKAYDYYHLNEKIYDCEDFQKLVMTNKNVDSIIKISSGTSDRKAFKGYITQSIFDLKKNMYYRNYSSPKGDRIARRALSLMESLKLTNGQTYEQNNVCLTIGSTGGITIVFEYIKNTFTDSEILIATPAYYVYRFATKYWKLSFKEVFPSKRMSFRCIDELISNITEMTRLVVITQPSNPTGEIYTPEELKKLFIIAKKKNILVLVDELFYDLIFEPEDYLGSTTVASSIDALENLVVIRGYSKNKNLAAFRLGYLLSKNTGLMAFAEVSSEVRQCFPVASNYTGLIGLDAFLQSFDYLARNTRGERSLIKITSLLKSELNFVQSICSKTNKELLNLYLNYKKYARKILNYYSTNYDIAIKILQDDIEVAMPKQAAFNTFVKIKGMNNVNYFDFCFNFYLTCGVETQIGPCYAFGQKRWQNDPSLGFWLRLTFARDRKQFIKGLQKFKEFKKIYLKNPDKFLQTKLYF